MFPQSHHRKAHLSIDALPRATLDRIDALTTVDAALFVKGLAVFFKQVKVVQRRAGHRILCRGALEAAQVKLAYLNVSLAALYAQA